MQDCHLPSAVRYRSSANLASLSDLNIGALLDECRNWSTQMEVDRNALTTVCSRTVWNVLTKQDHVEVADAIVRLREEVQRRLNTPLHSLLGNGDSLVAKFFCA